MSETIVMSINASVTSGPAQSINQTITVDAYDKFDIKVPDSSGATTGTSTTTVDLQPGVAAKVLFILVTCDQYSDKLSYTVGAGTDVYKLDAPHVLIGIGAVSMLKQNPTKFVFTNIAGKDKQVRILIGRNAI